MEEYAEGLPREWAACLWEEVDVVVGAALAAVECMEGLPQEWAVCRWEEVTADTHTVMGLGMMSSISIREMIMASSLATRIMAMVGTDTADTDTVDTDMVEVDMDMEEEVMVHSNRMRESRGRLTVTDSVCH